MDGDGIPDMARQRSEGEPDEAERDAFARKVLERATWFASDEGRRSMSDKRYRQISVARGMIEDVLHLAEEAGMSPLHVLEGALLNYSATNGFASPGIESVRAHVGAVLDGIEDGTVPTARRG